jgi:parallel beta-helix repeat protein
MRTSNVLAVSAVVLAANAGIAAGPAAAATHLHCGQTITHNTTLTFDLTGCAGDGLVVGAPGIVVDLAGHRIAGDGVNGQSAPDAGIRIDGFNGVTVKGGSITGFDDGVSMQRANGAAIRRMAVAHNVLGVHIVESTFVDTSDLVSTEDLVGVLVSDSDHVSVRGAALDKDVYVGIYTSGTTRSAFTDNVMRGQDFGPEGINLDADSNDNDVSGNRVTGAELSILIGGNGNRLTGNEIRDSRGGFVIIGDRNRIAGNRISNLVGCPPEQCGMGVSVEGGSGNVVTGNHLRNTHDLGIRVDAYVGDADHTVIAGNTVDAPGSIGIADDYDGVGPVTGTVITGNVVRGAVGDGIDVKGAGAAVGKNRASHNGGLGIRVVPDTRDLGGNLAWANGDTAQCSPTIVCGPGH